MLVARLPPATNNSSQHKSHPCIPGEYVGLVFLAGGAAGIFGVALVSSEQVITPATLAPSIFGISGCNSVEKWWANIYFST